MNILSKGWPMLITIEKNSTWTASNKKFKVTDIVEDNVGIWVHYINTTTDQKYHCLMEAFKSRFTKDVQ
jgi:hypothetical protein